MRARLMAYSRGMPEAKMLREKFAHVSSIAELEDIAAEHISNTKDRRAVATERGDRLLP